MCFRRSACHWAHKINKDKYLRKFQKGTPEQLVTAYQFLKGLDLFELQSCLDIAEGIESVVKGLECSGLTFLEAVEKISYNIGFIQYPHLADFLLQLICRRSQLKSNWYMMKRLIKARGHISPDLASNILLKATNTYPPDKSLCKDIYTAVENRK
nr:unnamed protein product [Callosobruchus chinensis]